MQHKLMALLIVAYVTRQATEDVEVDGVHIPKGTVVNLSPAVLNLQPSLWGDSAAEFDPDRWEAMEPTTAGMYSFESFHHGPRGCLGKTLSMAEMKRSEEHTSELQSHS